MATDRIAWMRHELTRVGYDHDHFKPLLKEALDTIEHDNALVDCLISHEPAAAELAKLCQQQAHEIQRLAEEILKLKQQLNGK